MFQKSLKRSRFKSSSCFGRLIPVFSSRTSSILHLSSGSPVPSRLRTRRTFPLSRSLLTDLLTCSLGQPEQRNHNNLSARQRVESPRSVPDAPPAPRPDGFLTVWAGRRHPAWELGSWAPHWNIRRRPTFVRRSTGTENKRLREAVNN